jgi:NDP-sugar pyrophosphorylase family protein
LQLHLTELLERKAAMVHPTLLILAAGMGSRYGGLKLIEPVGPGGESIMDYSIFDAQRAGFGRVIMVIRRGIEQQIKERIGSRFEKHLSVEYVFQEVNKLPPGFRPSVGRTRPWGTTHAILMAAGAIHEPFGVINVDDFYGAESYRALVRHLQAGTGDFATVGLTLRNTLSEFGTVARGVCRVDQNGYLENVLELKRIERDGGHARDVDSEGRETKLTGSEIVSMNMWGFTPEVFPLLDEHFQSFLHMNQDDLDAECFVPNTVNAILVAGQARVKVLRCEESWFGITYREDQSHAAEKIRRLIEAGLYPKKLW